MFRSSLLSLAAPSSLAAVLSQIQQKSRERPPRNSDAAPADVEARHLLSSLAEHSDDFVQFSKMCNVEILTMTALVATRARVKPDGKFVDHTLVPALVKRYSAAASSPTAEFYRAKNLSKQITRESILMRRLCDLKVFNSCASLHNKKRLLVDMVTRLCAMFTVHYELSIRRAASNKNNNVNVESSSPPITAVNHAVCALVESFEAAADDASRTLLGRATVRVMDSGCLFVVSSKTSGGGASRGHADVLPSEDVFGLVRILRHASAMLSALAAADSGDSALSNFASARDFCLTVVSLLRQPECAGVLRGSHSVTVLQACAKVLSARASHPLVFVDSGALLSEVKALAADTVRHFSKLGDALNNKNDQSAAAAKTTTTTSKSSRSSHWFDTTPAALCKAALSIVTLTADASSSGGAEKGEFAQVASRCMFAVAHDLVNTETHFHSALSTVAWCEVLTALRLFSRQPQHQQQQQRSGARQQDTQLLVSCFRRDFVKVFSRALQQDMTSATVVLASAVDLRLEVSMAQSEAAARTLLEHVTEKQKQGGGKELPVAPVFVLVRLLSRLSVQTLIRINKKGGEKEKFQQDENSSSVDNLRQQLLQLVAVLTASQQQHQLPLQLVTDVARNLFALGAAVSDLSGFLQRWMKTMPVGEKTTNAAVMAAPDAARQFLRAVCFAPVTTDIGDGDSDSSALEAALEKRRSLMLRLLCTLLVPEPALAVALPALWSTVGECVVRCSLCSSTDAANQELLARVTRRILLSAALRLLWSGGAGKGSDAAALQRSLLVLGRENSGGGGGGASIFAVAAELHQKAAKKAAAAGNEDDEMVDEFLLLEDRVPEHPIESSSAAASATLPWLDQQQRTGLKTIQRSVAEELVFLSACVEHGVSSQLRRDGATISLFAWVSEDAESRVAFTRAFNASLKSIASLDLQNDVTSKLPFALSSRSLRTDGAGDQSEGSIVRRAVISRVLSEMNVDGGSSGGGEQVVH